MSHLKISKHNIQEISLNAEKLNDHVFKQIEEDDNFIFFSKSTKESIKNYRKKYSDEHARNLWRDLLIDAVCLLKMNDRREKLYEDTEKIAAVFNKKFDGIRKMSTYGIDELLNYFDSFVEFESVLYGIGKYYRDHINHVLQVWAIGIGLIIGLNPVKINFNEDFIYNNKNFHYEITDNPTKCISTSEVLAMWTIIALCHDLGYPLEKASQINQKVKKIVNHFGCLNFTELNYNFDMLNSFIVNKFLNIISSKTVRGNNECKFDENKNCKDIKDCYEEDKKHKTEIQHKYHDKLSVSLENYKHGIFSGLLIYKKLTYFLETDYADGLSCEDLRQFYIRKEILRSICSHTCPKIYHLELNTLSFLLILCDELQEWGRPYFDDFKTGNIKDDHHIEISEFTTTKINNKINTKIHIKKDYVDTNIKDHIFKKKIEQYLIKEKYRNLHFLLRSAKDDKKREIEFTWEIKFKDRQYMFVFDSSKTSFDIFESYWQPIPTGKKENFPLYE